MISTDAIMFSISRNTGGMLEGARKLSQRLVETGINLDVFWCCDEHSEADIGEWHPLKPKIFPAIGPRMFPYHVCGRGGDVLVFTKKTWRSTLLSKYWLCPIT